MCKYFVLGILLLAISCQFSVMRFNFEEFNYLILFADKHSIQNNLF